MDKRDPHYERKQAILAEVPEIRKLYGVERRTQYYAYTIVALQLAAAYAVRNSWSGALALGFTIGPYLDAAVLCLIHEATHFLVFPSPAANRLLGIFTNIVLMIPLSEIFRQHHGMHHKNLGDEAFDVDVPSDFEIRVVGCSPLRKLFWLTFNMLILPARSLCKLPVHTDRFLVLNWVVSLGFGALTLFFSRQSFLYLLLSFLQSQGFHPANARQVQRHLFDGDDAKRIVDGPTTYSYYGWANLLTLNVGYHVEHHDFSHIPWTSLPKLRALAGPRWYPEDKAYHQRGLWDVLNFVINPDISLADFAH